MSDGEVERYQPVVIDGMTDEKITAMLKGFEERKALAKTKEQGYAVAGDLWWWQEVPPVRAWEHQGVLCAIQAGNSPGFNGYVQLPEGHPWVALDLQYGEGDLEVHGGITFGPHVTRWIGFDTAHAWDYWDEDTITKALEFLPEKTTERWKSHRRIEARYPIRNGPYDKVWTLEMLVLETEHLAEQVKAAGVSGTEVIAQPD